MSKLVIHVFHDDPASLSSAGQVAERIRQVKAERGVELEVYVFGPAQKALLNPECAEFNDRIDVLTCDGVPVGTCPAMAEALHVAETLRARGLGLEDASDAFIRFALDGATVISF
jgi:hypothetical protein